MSREVDKVVKVVGDPRITKHTLRNNVLDRPDNRRVVVIDRAQALAYVLASAYPKSAQELEEETGLHANLPRT